MTDRPFPNHRQAALALLDENQRLSRKEGQFLGQIAVDDTSLSARQTEWLAILLDRSGLPSLTEEGA